MRNTRTLTLYALLLLVCSPGVWSQLAVTSGLLSEQTAQAGDTYRGTITVQNNGGKDERVRIYQADYMFYADGSNVFADPGTEERSNAPWIEPARDEVQIAPGRSAEVEYVVRVPADRSLTGSYWSLVMVQSISDTALDPDRPDDEVGIQAGVRFAVQVVTHIGDSGERSLAFADPTLTRPRSEPLLRVDVENDGQRRLSPAFYVDVYGLDGSYGGRFEGSQAGLYPGTSRRVRIPLSGVEPGEYRVQFVADAGGSDLFGAIYAVTVDEKSGE